MRVPLLAPARSTSTADPRFAWPILLRITSRRPCRDFADSSLAWDLRKVIAVELWKLRKDLGVVRASLADVLAQAEAARRAVDQLRWLLRDEEQAPAAEQQISAALERVNAAVGNLCDSATQLHEAAKTTAAGVTEPGASAETANLHVKRH